ncbi:MAG: hypothetical protein MI749_07215, partial [Desulfovibrionales bacterium]|nr:hypothetical protein [Desulfovibrionales bacterium]
MVVVAVTVAVSLMHGEAYAQTDVRIGVLTSHPDDIDAGPLGAMALAERDLDREYEAIGSTVTLHVIDVSDFTNATSVAQKIGGALQQGFTHFIAPSDEGALGFVKGVADFVTPSSILISPKPQTTIDESFYADDSLFRLTPNNNELAKETIPVFDKYGTERLIMGIDAARGGDLGVPGAGARARSLWPSLESD